MEDLIILIMVVIMIAVGYRLGRINGLFGVDSEKIARRSMYDARQFCRKCGATLFEEKEFDVQYNSRTGEKTVTVRCKKHCPNGCYSHPDLRCFEPSLTRDADKGEYGI